MGHWVKWLLLAVVRPLAIMWLILWSAPSIITALFKGLVALAKVLK